MKDRSAIADSFRLLGQKQATGILRISFGRGVPEAVVRILDGKPLTAKYGNLKNNEVFDLLLCQGSAIKEIDFQSGSARANENRDVLRDIESVLAEESTNVNGCKARPYIFGLLHVTFPDGKSNALLQMLHDFRNHKDFLMRVTTTEKDVEAPLFQCVLFYRALKSKAVEYKSPLLAVNSLGPLFEIVQPLEEREAESLRGYLNNLLPHPQASHIPLDRFYAFASAVESMAYRRGPDRGDEARKIIFRMIKGSDDDNLSGAAVSAGDPSPGPLSASAEEAEPKAEPSDGTSDGLAR
jgi:hypothetical protein